MKDIIELLKTLKTIEPDREYAARSRALIIEAAQPGRLPHLWVRFVQTLEVGAAFALLALFAVLFVGGGLFTPLRTSSLDSSSLRAEAQAIDIQIQLTNINYQATLQSANAESTVAAPVRASHETPTVSPEPESGESTKTAEPATEPLGIDDALLELAR